MLDKIMRCRCGRDPQVQKRRMFSDEPPLAYGLQCVYHPQGETQERPHLYQAINEWNRMQMSVPEQIQARAAVVFNTAFLKEREGGES